MNCGITSHDTSRTSKTHTQTSKQRSPGSDSGFAADAGARNGRDQPSAPLEAEVMADDMFIANPNNAASAGRQSDDVLQFSPTQQAAALLEGGAQPFQLPS